MFRQVINYTLKGVFTRTWSEYVDVRYMGILHQLIRMSNDLRIMFDSLLPSSSERNPISASFYKRSSIYTMVNRSIIRRFGVGSI